MNDCAVYIKIILLETSLSFSYTNRITITPVDASNDNKKTNINSGRYKRASMFAHVIPANEPHANSVNACVSVTEHYEKQTSKLVCYEIEVKLI